MAINAAQMQKPEEKFDPKLVAALENEFDNFLSSQELGKKEYTFSWEKSVSAVNLQELRSKYEQVGWHVVTASDDEAKFTTITVSPKEAVNFRPWRASQKTLGVPKAVVKSNPKFTTLKEMTEKKVTEKEEDTKPAKLPGA